MSDNDEVMKAIEDIATGKAEEQIIWQKSDTPETEEPDPLEYATQMGLYDEPVMHPELVSLEDLPDNVVIDEKSFRAHDEDHKNCWCNKKIPVIVLGHDVGVAVPLENGDYSMIFDDSNAGRLVKTLIDMGTEHSFSISNDQGILDLGEED